MKFYVERIDTLNEIFGKVRKIFHKTINIMKYLQENFIDQHVNEKTGWWKQNGVFSHMSCYSDSTRHYLLSKLEVGKE